MIKKIKASPTTLKAWALDVLGQFKEVNAFVHGVDPWVSKISWIGPIWRAVLSFGFLGATGLILQQVIRGYVSTGQGISNFTIGTVVTVFVLYSVSRMAFLKYGRWREQIFEDRLKAACETRYVEKIATLDLGRLLDPKFVALERNAGISNGHEDGAVDTIQRIWEFQRETVGTIVSAFMALAVFAVLDPMLMILAFIPAVANVIRDVMHDKKGFEVREQNNLIARTKNAYLDGLSDPYTFLQSKLFRGVPFLRERFSFYRDLILSNRRTFERRGQYSSVATELIEVVILGFVIVHLGSRLQAGTLGFDGLILIIGSVKMATGAVNRLFNVYTRLRRHLYGYGKFREFMKVEPLIDESEARDVSFTKTPAIHFNDVSFGYPRSESTQVLKDCSLSIEPGERVILVGKNGAGKTSLLNLLAKVYLPQTGSVTIDGFNTKVMRQESLLDQIVYMSQNSRILELPVNEAIALTLPDRIDDERFHRAASLAGVNEFDLALPQGFATRIGASWDDGKALSGGQMQRLKLASAFYRLLDPKVRIGLFDEPNSQCDVEMREHFHRGLKGFPDKTIIVVAHDPLYLHHFDRVIVMEQGEIVSDIRGTEAILDYRESITMRLSADLLE